MTPKAMITGIIVVSFLLGTFLQAAETTVWQTSQITEGDGDTPAVTRAVPAPNGYNRLAAYGYAYRWWDDRNPHYKDYSSSGGDCANFVSQCLIAGGLSLHKGTDGSGYGVYPDVDRSSYSNGTIPFCDYLDLHLRNYQNTSVTYVTDDSPSVPDEITVGDVVIFGDKSGDKYKHAMLVVWDGGSEIGLAGHSSSVWNRTFTQELSYFSCATFYHISDGQGEYHHFRVTTSVLNVRVGPGTNGLGDYYQDIGDIHDGEEYVAFGYELDDQGRKWWHFWYDDRAAWCAAWYTAEVQGNRPFEVNVSSYLNVRSGPSTTYSIVGQVYDGMRFISDHAEGEWYRYWYGGQQAYSHSGYVDDLYEDTGTGNHTAAMNGTVMGYLPYWVSRTGINYSALTHLAWFSVEVNSDGSLGNKHGWPDWEVINDAHAAGCKVILTATLMDSSAIHTLISTPSYRTACINNLLAEVQAGNADGINIDFEMPKTSGDDVYLVQFMQELNTTFKNANPDYHVSIAGPSEDWWGTWDYGALSEHLDAFMIMAYGYYWSGSSRAGPTSPLDGGSYNIKNTIQEYLSGGAPRYKILLGLPLYGYDYPVEDSTKQSSTRGSGSSKTYSAALSLAQQYGATLNYDTTFQCVWFNYYKSGDGWHQVWFDNLTSLEVKFDYAINENLAGIGIWAWGYQGSHDEIDSLVAEKFSADTEPPQITITSPANGTYINTSTVTVLWTGNDDRGISSYYISVDGGAWQDKGAWENQTLTLPDGTHTIKVMAMDSGGNTAEDSVTIVVDTTPPVVTILSPTEGMEFYTTNITVYWTASDLTTLGPYDLYLDGMHLASATEEKYNLTSLSLGTHTFRVAVEDALGHQGDDVVNFTVKESTGEDTTPPQVTITAPADGSFADSGTVVVSWIGQDDRGIASYSLSLDGDSWSDVGMATSHTFLYLSEGGHTVTVRAADTSGNTGEASVSFTIDTTPPELTILSPADDSVTSSGSVAVTLSLSDASGISELYYSIDGGDMKSVSGPYDADVTVTITPGDGEHYIEFTAEDMVGHVSSETLRITVDTVKPNIDITSPEDGAVLGTLPVVVGWNASDNIGVSGYSYSLDGGETVNTTQPGLTLSPADGTHTLTVYAWDLAGNSGSDTVSFVIDTTPPEVKITHPFDGAVLEDGNLTVEWSAEDINAIVGAELLVDGETAYSGNATSFPLSLSEGTHVLEVAAQDIAGNTGRDSVSVTVVLPGEESFNITVGPLLYGNGTPASGVAISISGDDGVATAETDSGGMASFLLSPGFYSGSVISGNSTYDFLLFVYSNGTADYILPVIPAPITNGTGTNTSGEGGNTTEGTDTGTSGNEGGGTGEGGGNGEDNGTEDTGGTSSTTGENAASTASYLWIVLAIVILAVAGAAAYIYVSRKESEDNTEYDEEEDDWREEDGEDDEGM